MSKILKGGLIAVISIIFAYVAIGMVVNPVWKVSRAVVISAPAEAIFPLIANLSRWEEWSTWNQRELPDLQMRYEGPTSGQGASSRWMFKGATGFTTITLAAGNEIAYHVSAMPNSFYAEGTIKLLTVADGTRVEWSYGGDMGTNPLFKAWMLGYIHFVKSGFEVSLQRLKTICEAPLGLSSQGLSGSPPMPNKS